MDSETGEYDVVVIGGGAAGLTGALVLARALRRVVVVDGGRPRNSPAEHMHGFLTRDGMPPAELVRTGRAEVSGYGGELVEDFVADVQPGLVIHLESGRELRTRRLLVATGLRDELPDIAGIQERWGKDVLHCPYCHGWEVRDQPIAVLPAGPQAVDHALLIRQWSTDLTLLSDGLELQAHDRERLEAREIKLVEGKPVRLVVDDDRLQAVELDDGRTIPLAALFVAPNFLPNDHLLKQLGCELVDDVWVKTDPTGRTSVPSIWAAGNVVNPFANVLTSASEGSIAAAAINVDLVAEDVERPL